MHVGIHDAAAIYDNNLYFNSSDDFGVRFTVPVMRLPIDDIKDVDYYNYIKNINGGFINEDMIRYIQKDISSNVFYEEIKIVLPIILLILVIGTSFVIWQITLKQEDVNTITGSCFKIEFSDKNPITLNNSYPI